MGSGSPQAREEEHVVKASTQNWPRQIEGFTVARHECVAHVSDVAYKDACIRDWIRWLPGCSMFSSNVLYMAEHGPYSKIGVT